MLRIVDFVVSQSTGELGEIYIGFQRQIDGRQDFEQRWKDCVNILSLNLPFAIGATYVQRYLKADTKSSIVEMFNNIKEDFAGVIAEAEWIDKSTREKLLNKLKSVVPLIAYPDDGFDEHVINEFYSGVKIDKNHYMRTLFQLRVIDADNKFRQTFPSTALDKADNWLKYLPPTAATASYSESDNTIRKIGRSLSNSSMHEAVINFN